MGYICWAIGQRNSYTLTSHPKHYRLLPRLLVALTTYCWSQHSSHWTQKSSWFLTKAAPILTNTRALECTLHAIKRPVPDSTHIKDTSCSRWKSTETCNWTVYKKARNLWSTVLNRTSSLKPSQHGSGREESVFKIQQNWCTNEHMHAWVWQAWTRSALLS